MQNLSNKKVRKGRCLKNYGSDYLFHLYEVPQATEAKVDLLCQGQKQENEVLNEKMKIKMLTKSCQNFEPWQFERKSSFGNQEKQKGTAVNKETHKNDCVKKRSLILERGKFCVKSQIGVDKIKRCSSLNFEGRQEELKMNKRYYKNISNKTSQSFNSLRKMMGNNAVSNLYKNLTEVSFCGFKNSKNVLSKTMRSSIKNKKKFSNFSEIIEIEHPLVCYNKIQREMIGKTLRKKMPKNRQSNLICLKNSSINLCHEILMKKSNPVQKEISKIIKLLLE